MKLLPILFAIAASAIAGTLSTTSAWHDASKPKRVLLVSAAVVSIFAAIATGVNSIQAGRKQQEAEAVQRKQYEEMITAQRMASASTLQLAHAQTVIADKTEQVLTLSGQLVNANERIAAIGQQAVDQITGGDNRGNVRFYWLNGFQSDTVEISLENTGATALTEVVVSVFDEKMQSKPTDSSMTDFGLPIENVPSTLAPGRSVRFWRGSLKGKEHVYWFVHLMQRNANISEVISVRKINKGWSLARISVGQVNGKKILEERIPPDFPRSESGRPLM